MPNLVELGPSVLEKKKFLQCSFAVSLLYPLGKGHDPSFEPSLMMLCARFGLNWPCGSEEEVVFLVSSMYFKCFFIISTWKRAWPFI